MHKKRERAFTFYSQNSKHEGKIEVNADLLTEEAGRVYANNFNIAR